MSAARAKAIREYLHLRGAFLRRHRYCQLCHAAAAEVHHTRGRSGKFLLDERFWLPVCRSHHEFAHSHPERAREMGLFPEKGLWLCG